MEETYRTVAAAVGASTKLHIELDGGISMDFNDAELCQDLGLAIRDHYLKVERQSARRKTLWDAIGSNGSKATGLRKWLITKFNVHDWTELDDITLTDFKEFMLNESGLCRSTVHAYLSKLTYVIKTYGKTMNVSSENYRDILKIHDDSPKKTYLNERDIWKLEEVEARTPGEKKVKCLFLVGCYTGARISDIINLSEDNIHGTQLTYVSQKTKIQSTIPLKPKVVEWLREANSKELPEMTAAGYNMAIKRLCKRAGIDEIVKVYKAGKALTGPKWKFISSHSARISMATNLSNSQEDIYTISQLLGHAKVDQTARYIVDKRVHLNAVSSRYFE